MIKSAKELSMLMMFLATGIIFFSTIMYFLEKDIPMSGFDRSEFEKKLKKNLFAAFLRVAGGVL
jgi:hypothetical protein